MEGEPDLQADEELSTDSDIEFPLQEPHISSSISFYSGSRRSVPFMRNDCFIYIFPENHSGEYGSVFVESPTVFNLSEYNFSRLFVHFDDLTLEFHLPFYDLFHHIVDFKWYESDLEFTVNRYSERNIALVTFPNLDYWPPILAWFARQCLTNGISFFDHVRLFDENNETEYGIIFA